MHVLLPEDVKYKVDLRCQTHKELSLFQIKGVAGGERTVVLEITPETKESVKSKITRGRVRDPEKLKGDVEAILKYAQNLQAVHNLHRVKQVVKAYWVQVEPED